MIAPAGFLGGQVNFINQAQQLKELSLADQVTSGGASGTGTLSTDAQVVQNSNSKVIPQLTSDGTPTAGSSVTSTSSDGSTNPNSIIPVNTQEKTLQTAKDFHITFPTVGGGTGVFRFALMPAIETTMRSNNAGMSVPEVKPGILLKTTMSYKRFSLPGAPPVFQSLGIEQTILQMVGLFVGAEGINQDSGSVNNILYGRFGLAPATSVSAYNTADIFDKKVVQSGREVQLLINADGSTPDAPLSLSYGIVIQNFRYFVTRSDRVYYAIDALVTTYQVQRLALSASASTPTPTTPTTAAAVNANPATAVTRPQASPAARTGG